MVGFVRFELKCCGEMNLEGEWEGFFYGGMEGIFLDGNLCIFVDNVSLISMT